MALSEAIPITAICGKPIKPRRLHNRPSHAARTILRVADQPAIAR
jgi:hypothetical protein